MTEELIKSRESTLRGLLLIAYATLLFGCAAGVGSPQSAAGPEDETAQQASGVRGTVLRGPVQPGPLIGDAPDELPFRAAFRVLGVDEAEVARFESNDQGEFEVALAPGSYTIVPTATAPLMTPEQQRHGVEVVAGEMLEVTLRFDTGIR